VVLAPAAPVDRSLNVFDVRPDFVLICDQYVADAGECVVDDVGICHAKMYGFG
jgi:hypothetical protein